MGNPKNRKPVGIQKIVRRESVVDTIMVSFSGGRSSGMMARLMQLNPRYKNKKLVFVFANVGREREETLQFVKDCDDHFGFNTVWIEAVISQTKGVGAKYKIVTFETATRLGEHGPFDDLIQKLDIPNPNKPGHCTRDLKIVPMEKYMLHDLGHKPKDYVSAIGIRCNEPKRLSMNVAKIYPLADFDIDELAVRQWWKKQSFDLQLEDYQGNCVLCHLKSEPKILQNMVERPESETMWRINHEEASPRNYIFARGEKPARQLYEKACAGDFTPVKDKFAGRDVLAEPLAYNPDIFKQARKRGTPASWKNKEKT